MKKLIFLMVLSLAFACGQPTHHHKSYAKQTMHSYQTQDDSGNWIWWYIMMSNNGSTTNYYSYSSPVAVTDFSSVQFTQSATAPIDLQEAKEMAEQEMTVEELPAEMQAEISDNPENFGGMTEDEMGDYEGGTESDGDNGSADDGGSSDAGSSDGGGDGGGGDGGGD